MNKIIISIVAILIIIGGIAYYKKRSAPTTQANQITFPAGGETLVRGKTYTLTWTGGSDPIQIFLVDRSLKANGASVSISDRVYGIKNEHSYSYTVPVVAKPGEYEFQIGTATSKPFLIIAE